MNDEQQARQDKLRALMADIRETCARADVAAAVLLYDDHQSEQLMFVEPTWSRMTHDEETGAVRIRSKAADYGGDKERQRDELERTVGMIFHFADYGKRLVANCDLLTMMLEKHGGLKIETTRGKFTPHRPPVKKRTDH